MLRLRGDPLALSSIALAAILGAIAVAFRPIGDFGVETDFYADFAPNARLWMSGDPQIMNGFRGPGYYLALGTVSAVVRDMFLAGKLLSVASAAASLFIVGRLLQRQFDRPVRL